MKRYIIFIITIILYQFVNGQVETRLFTKGDAFNEVDFIKEHPKTNHICILPSFDKQKYLEEEELRKDMLDVPFRFGKGFNMNINLSDGEWLDVKGGQLWMMEFKSEKAYSMNFIFNEFYLCNNAKLYIINSEGTMLYGPVTSEHNTENGYFLTDLIQGDDVTIYLFEPSKELGKSRLTISRVVHAYKNLFSGLGESDTCNNDVVCFPSWDTESDAVALVLLSNGEEWCSGSLLITTDYSFKPYFLSAFHCIDIGDPEIPWYIDEDEDNGVLEGYEISEAENWMFRYQFKMKSCGGYTTTKSVTYNGANFKSAWYHTDFALMEMDNSPLGDNRFTWLGWNRYGSSPSSGAGIHHPSGDAMKISFENDQFQVSSWNGTNNHWLLYFDDGVVEHGSSGSPVLDQNKRVVGQLHGNQYYNPNLTYCEQPRAEYGRFNISWTGGATNSTRLSNWLDPVSTGDYTTNTLRSPYVSGPYRFCSSGTFTLDNIPPVNSIIWTCGPHLTITSGQYTSQCTVAVTSSGSSFIQVRLVTDYGDITLPSKTVYVGAPPLYDISGPATIVLNNTEHYISSFLPKQASKYGINYYDWSITSKLQFESSHAYQIDVYIKGITLGFGTISFYTTNNCGTSTFNFPVRVVSGKGLLIYPNPASNEITITINEPEAIFMEDVDVSEVTVSKAITTDQITYTIRIYNSLGTLVSSAIRTGTSFDIPLPKLRDGTYIVELNDGKNSYREQLIIKHE